MSRREPSVNDVVRVGRVTAVYEDRHTVTVEFPDRGDGLVTKELPVRASATRNNHFYAMPDEGEHVVCEFYGNGLSEGVVTGCIYDAKNRPPLKSRDKTYAQFGDKTLIEYDRKLNRLLIDCSESGGQVVVIAPQGVMITGNVNITGNIAVSGNIQASGSITDTSGNTNHHTH